MMTEIADPPIEQPAKRSRMPLFIGLILALVGAGAGFAAIRFGLVGGTETAEATDESPRMEPLRAATFLPLDPLTINLPDPSGRRFLRFVAQLEVDPRHASEVEAVMPRIVDVLNGYLRAIPVSDLEDPTALLRLRAQMLRRVQVVTGEGRVHDLLIMEFILN
jgi:flagellar FliL protein